MKNILIAGGTGFVGKHLVSYLVERGYPVNLLSRKIKESSPGIRCFKWDIESGFIDKKAFENVGTVINLTGANISEKRWTPERRKEILESRTRSLDLLLKYVNENNFRINTLISSSAAGYYGAVTKDEIFTESSENGHDFLGLVCRAWERSALQFERSGIKTIILRKGIVIGQNGGMYKKLAPLARQGINTSLGNGKHYIPWIAVEDLVRLYGFILDKSEVKGTFNAVASEHITMNELSAALLRSFGKKSILPNVPAFVIKLGYGAMSAILLEGSRVSNQKIKEAGFHFERDTIGRALL